MWLKAKLLRPPSQRSRVRNASVGPAINIFQKSFSDVSDVAVGVGILCLGSLFRVGSLPSRCF